VSDPTNTLFDRRLLLFTGKGGVGKTTVVAALALEAARRGLRPLIVELGHRASMEGVFETKIGYRPSEVGRGVWAMNLEFEPALAEYFLEHIPVKRVARSITRNKTLQRFFHAAPSVAEVATLNKLSMLEAERDAAGEPRWDLILVDLDATGHAVMLLNLPAVLSGLIGDGPMRKLVDGFSNLLRDPRRTVLSLVTLPRELPAQETVELWQRLDQKHDVALGLLFVNQVPQRPLTPSQAGLLDQVQAWAQKSKLTTLSDNVVLTRRAMRYHANARAQINRMRRDVAMPMVEFPRVAGRELGLETLAEFGRQAMQAVEAGDPHPGASASGMGRVVYTGTDTNTDTQTRGRS